MESSRIHLAYCTASLQAVHHECVYQCWLWYSKVPAKYHAAVACQLPPPSKYCRAIPYLCTALSTKKIWSNGKIRAVSAPLFACETGMWRRTRIRGESSVTLLLVQLGCQMKLVWRCSADEQHVHLSSGITFSTCVAWQNLGYL